MTCAFDTIDRETGDRTEGRGVNTSMGNIYGQCAPLALPWYACQHLPLCGRFGWRPRPPDFYDRDARNPHGGALAACRREFEVAGLSERVVALLHGIFAKADADDSGAIDVEELIRFLDLPEELPLLRRVFLAFDLDGSGELEFREFVLAVWSFCRCATTPPLIAQYLTSLAFCRPLDLRADSLIRELAANAAEPPAVPTPVAPERAKVLRSSRGACTAAAPKATAPAPAEDMKDGCPSRCCSTCCEKRTAASRASRRCPRPVRPWSAQPGLTRRQGGSGASILPSLRSSRAAIRRCFSPSSSCRCGAPLAN